MIANIDPKNASDDDFAIAAAYRLLGISSDGETQYSVINVRGRPRWIIPRSRPRVGPVKGGLYQHASARSRIGAWCLELAYRASPRPHAEISARSKLGITQRLEDALGRHGLRIAVRLPREERRSRIILCILHQSKIIAIAKVDTAGSPELQTEAIVLDCLGQQQTTALATPDLIATFSWRGYDVTLQGALSFRGRTNREIGRRETAALVELAQLTDELRATVRGPGHALVHGDFCGWNSGWLADDRLGLWDWEWARLGEPLEDWFHWQTQRLVHFGYGAVADLVNEALAPSSQLRDLCARLGIGIDTAPSSLAASLRAGLARLGDATGLQVDLRHEALEMLQGGVG